MLIAGSMMRHITTHLATIDEAQFERVKAMCVSLGEVLVRPLAEALSVEERPRTRERLTAILLAFGVGRPADDRAAEELAESGGAADRHPPDARSSAAASALPDLTELLDDNEPQVQREAVRAILNIGTDAAYRILEQALTGGTTQSRDAIMQSIGLVRDERATPLFAYILEHVDHRGAARAGLPARHRIARRAARSGRHRAAARRAVQGRMVGAAADRDAARRRRGGAGAHRHAGRLRRARRSGRRGLAAASGRPRARSSHQPHRAPPGRAGRDDA